MREKDKIYDSLIALLKMFKNRPYHLAKYLIDNKALNDTFIKKIIGSNIKNIDMETNFKDIAHLNEYFSSLIDDNPKEKTMEEISIELSQKLDQLLKDEKYEEAIYVRDYMNKNNITRIIF